MIPSLSRYALTGVLAEHPWLAEFECPSCPAVESHQFGLAFDWFVNLREPINPRRCAYSMKSEVEIVAKASIGQRAFLGAALAAGYSVRFAETGTAYLA